MLIKQLPGIERVIYLLKVIFGCKTVCHFWLIRCNSTLVVISRTKASGITVQVKGGTNIKLYWSSRVAIYYFKHYFKVLFFIQIDGQSDYVIKTDICHHGPMVLG
jgi:hypothetical protein